MQRGYFALVALAPFELVCLNVKDKALKTH